MSLASLVYNTEWYLNLTIKRKQKTNVIIYYSLFLKSWVMTWGLHKNMYVVNNMQVFLYAFSVLTLDVKYI